MDDDLEHQDRVAPHQDNYQSSGAEDDMSDWFFDANLPNETVVGLAADSWIYVVSIKDNNDKSIFF